MMKRSFDIVVSLIVVVLFSWLLALIALIILITSRGGVFFRGERIGVHGKPFRIFKFRSMVVNADKLGPMNVGDTDPRVTWIGRILRTTKLDELPQLIDVFLGHISLVGPRPELQHYVAMYTEDEKRILDMRPGITDWASLVHYDQYEEFAAAEDPDAHYLERIRPLKLKLQLYYRDTACMGSDILILILTGLRFLGVRWLPKAVKAIASEHHNSLAQPPTSPKE